jgi:hypothetical protein
MELRELAILHVERRGNPTGLALIKFEKGSSDLPGLVLLVEIIND